MADQRGMRWVVVPWLLAGLLAHAAPDPAATPAVPAVPAAPAEPAPAPIVRKPVPDATAIKLATTQANQLFRKDIADAKTFHQRGELLKRLRRVADEETRPDLQYVTLHLIRDLVIRWDEHHPAALSALAAVETYFEADALDARTDVLIRGANKAAVSRHGYYAEFAIEMADDAIRRERFDAAKRIAGVAQSSARRALEPPLVTRATTLARNVTSAEQLGKEAVAAASTLARTPNDAKANQALGRFRCLVKGDWAGGLVLLAQGEDLVLRSIARLEIDNPSGAESQAMLADAWLEAGKSETGLLKDRMAARAREWYVKALPEAQGLTKVRIEKVLPEIERQLDPLPPRIEKTFLADLTATSVDKNNQYRLGRPAVPPRRPPVVPPNPAVPAVPAPKNVTLTMGSPRGSLSFVTYAIPQNARTVSGVASFDSLSMTVRGPQELIVRIYVDGKPKFQSAPLLSGQSEPFEVRVANGAELRLELEYTGRSGYPTASFVDAVFE